jgi:hypothetical protein
MLFVEQLSKKTACILMKHINNTLIQQQANQQLQILISTAAAAAMAWPMWLHCPNYQTPIGPLGWMASRMALVWHRKHKPSNASATMFQHVQQEPGKRDLPLITQPPLLSSHVPFLGPAL